MKSTEKELLLINKQGGYIQSDVDDVSKQLIKNGCVLKSIYEVSSNFKIRVQNKWVAASDEDLINIFNRFEKQGEQIRLYREVFQNFVIIHRKIVFVSLAAP